MNKSLIAILAGVAISITGCTNAGESTVSDYEQGGYFKEEQQLEQQKEVESKANTNTTHNNTTQPTKINDKQQTERKHNSNRTNTTKQYKKSTKGVDKVKHNSESSEEPKEEPKQDNQSTQENIKQDDELVCPLCGNPIHNGYDNVIVGNTLYHRECYQREFGKNGEYRP
jgi:rubrerythrin